MRLALPVGLALLWPLAIWIRARLRGTFPAVRSDEGWFDDIERDDLAG